MLRDSEIELDKAKDVPDRSALALLLLYGLIKCIQLCFSKMVC